MNITEHGVSNLICNKYEKQHPIVENYMSTPRPFYTFAYVLSGTLQCLTDSYCVTAHQGDILFIPFRIRYRLCWTEPNTAVYSCHFNFPSYSKPFGNKEFLLQKISGYENRRNDFEYILKHIHDDDCFLGVLYTFYKLCDDLYPSLTYVRTLCLSQRMQKAVDYINANYRNDISIEELANVCCLSPSHFYYCFKQELGMTAIEYKNSICIKHAILLLLDTNNMPIEDISAECGFHSAEYFRRVFKAIMGKTPGEYRKTMKSTL